MLRGGRKRLVVRLPDGSSLTIQREWTDADGLAPESVLAQETALTTTALLDLAALVDALGARL